MIELNLVQGSAEWHEHRNSGKYFNASDAPAMMGVSPYKTRQQLIKEYATGIRPEVDAHTQRLFDEGHRIEALALPVAENIIGEPLYPVVGVNGRLSASFDGLTMDQSIGYEHKTLNNELRSAIPMISTSETGKTLPAVYRIQMQQQCDVSGAERILFGATRWDGDQCIEERWCWYSSDPELSAQIAAGWLQFEKDVAAYAPEEVKPDVTAKPVESLPAVAVTVSGTLAIKSNLDAFGERLKGFVGGLVMQPSTDQEFADADAAVKALQNAEDMLKAAQANIIAQVSDVEALNRTIADLSNIARDARLSLSKSVEKRKEQIKVEIVQEGQRALAEHIATINSSFNLPYMPTVPADFAGAIKGRRTVDTTRNAMLDCLAKAKVDADLIAGRIRANLAVVNDLGGNHKHLFHDVAQIILKQTEDVTALVKSRIAEYVETEEKRIATEREEIARQERERIAREERAKIEAEERAKAAEKKQPAQTTNFDVSVTQSVPAPTPQKPVAVDKKTIDADDELIAVIAKHLKCSMGDAVKRIKSIDIQSAEYRHTNPF